jgi:predicted lysophospholipase L1 biosynthesis ABC-type transport system permease subunit
MDKKPIHHGTETMTGKVTVIAAGLGAGVATWTVVDIVQSHVDFFDPTFEKLLATAVVAGYAIIGSILGKSG